MQTWGWLAVTLLVALTGGIIGYKLKLPAGAMLGAMFFVVIFNLATEKGYFYSDIRVGVQILSGVMIGSRIGKKDILELKQIILPMVILLISMVILNITFGMAIYRFSDLDVATSLFATAPGGLSDMALISEELGANPAYVGLLQLFRILTLFTFFPSLFKKIVISYRNKKGIVVETDASAATDTASPAAAGTGETKKIAGIKEKLLSQNMLRLYLLIAIGSIAGLFLRYLNVTAGAMVGSMIVSAVFCVFKGKIDFPANLRVVMQSLSGAYLGTQLNRQNIMQTRELVVPLLIMFVGIFMFVFAVSFFMHKVTGLDLAVCLLSSTPGGVSEMSLLSEDLGADTPKIAIMQTVRLFSVILTFPAMLSVIISFF